jgi:hypothetical protein
LSKLVTTPISQEFVGNTVDNLNNESCNSIELRNRVVETVDNHVGEEKKILERVSMRENQRSSSSLRVCLICKI